MIVQMCDTSSDFQLVSCHITARNMIHVDYILLAVCSAGGRHVSFVLGLKSPHLIVLGRKSLHLIVLGRKSLHLIVLDIKSLASAFA